MLSVTKNELPHRLACTVVVGLALTMFTGCPASPTPPDDGSPVDLGQGIKAAVIAPSTSFGISVLEDPISVFYTVTGATGKTDVSGYYVPLTDGDTTGSAAGDRVILDTRDLDGDTDFFSFDPGAAGVGYYRLGILVSVDGVELDPVEGTAIVEVQGSPSPAFVLPDTPITTVVPGDFVLITFDAGDPQNVVAWRLFLLDETDSRTASPEKLGTELTTGSGNTGQYILNTTDLPIGTYEVGISATDTGRTVSATVSIGLADRIITIPNNTQGGRLIEVVESIQ